MLLLLKALPGLFCFPHLHFLLLLDLQLSRAFFMLEILLHTRSRAAWC
jgi:hypothetical protein